MLDQKELSLYCSLKVANEEHSDELYRGVRSIVWVLVTGKIARQSVSFLQSENSIAALIRLYGSFYPVTPLHGMLTRHPNDF